MHPRHLLPEGIHAFDSIRFRLLDEPQKAKGHEPETGARHLRREINVVVSIARHLTKKLPLWLFKEMIAQIVQIKNTSYDDVDEISEPTSKEDAGNNLAHDDVKLSQISTKALEQELLRRKDEHRKQYEQRTDCSMSSVEFFLAEWGDVLGKAKTISKQRVRDHDGYLMGLIESFISNRIKAGKDLGELEGVTFLINEEKSTNRSRKYTLRRLTVPGPSQ